MDIQAAIARDSSGQAFLALIINEGVTAYQVYLTDAEHSDEVIRELTRGLKTAAAELRREASGIITVKGVPDGLSGVRPAEGRE